MISTPAPSFRAFSLMLARDTEWDDRGMTVGESIMLELRACRDFGA